VPASAPVKVILALTAMTVLALAGLVAWWVFNPAWNQCSSYVDDRLVEHKCSEEPPRFASAA
jgi:hypothetical protein